MLCFCLASIQDRIRELLTLKTTGLSFLGLSGSACLAEGAHTTQQKTRCTHALESPKDPTTSSLALPFSPRDHENVRPEKQDTFFCVHYRCYHAKMITWQLIIARCTFWYISNTRYVPVGGNGHIPKYLRFSPLCFSQAPPRHLTCRTKDKEKNQVYLFHYETWCVFFLRVVHLAFPSNFFPGGRRLIFFLS